MEQNQTLILSLIKEDLRCSKLVNGLNELGLDAGKYHTELNNIVFDLMGFDVQNDSLLEFYFNCLEEVAGVKDVEDMEAMGALARDIYERLVGERERRGY